MNLPVHENILKIMSQGNRKSELIDNCRTPSTNPGMKNTRETLCPSMLIDFNPLSILSNE